MTDDLRRQDDHLLASLDKRLALLEQAHTLQAQAAEARSHLTEKSFDALGAKVDAAITLWQNVTAEPSASPAGRALLADVGEIKGDVAAMGAKVELHDEFYQQTQGAIRLAKFAIGTSLLAAVVSFLQIVALVQRGAP